MITLDYSKKWRNTDKFRPAAIHFQKYGYYTSVPKGTSEYKKYWDEQRRRSLYGYITSDGDYITGYHYFYLNFCIILVARDKEVTGSTGKKRIQKVKEPEFPYFWDSDKQYFDLIQEAEEQGKHMIVLKARRKGYSYKSASMLMRNYFLIPKSVNAAIASETEFLTKDGILTKAWDMMDFIDEHTAFTKKRQKTDTKMHKRASMVVDKDGTKVEIGYKSEVIGMTLKNDAQKIRGKSYNLAFFEECLAKGTEVIMSDMSLKKVEDIKVGDEVLNPNGVGYVVRGIHNGKSNLYNVKQNYGDDYVVSENHKLRLLWGRRDYIPKQIDVENNGLYSISVRDYLKLPKYIRNESYGIKSNGFEFNTNDELEIPPYMFGYWLGDGDKNNASVCTNDSEIIYHFTTHMSEVNSNYSYSIYSPKRTTAKIITFGEYYYKGKQKRNKVNTKLRELKVMGNKHIPYVYKISSVRDRLKLLAGFIDADGSLKEANKGNTSYYDIVHKEGRLIDDIKFVAESLGFRVSKSRKKVKYKDEYKYYTRLRIIGNIYEIPVKIERKKVVKFERLIRLSTTPISVNSIGEGDYYGFTLETLIDDENERSFLLKDFTITQNSGKFPNLLTAWQIAQRSADGDGGTTGMLIGFGTGGTEQADYGGLKELFYSPSAYNILPLNNIWDSGAEGTECGFFVPAYVNIGVEYMDKNGNTLFEKSKNKILTDRKIVEEKANNKSAIDRHIAELPINPMEATLQLSGNIFPKKDLAQQLARIQTNKKLSNFKQVGDLIFDNIGELKWIQTTGTRDIEKYPLDRSEDKTGAIVIWEHPPEDIPYGLYIAGCDPYDHDDSGTGSLGSTFIYKRFQDFESYYDMIVAEYTGRPETAEEYYENVRKLLLYYNATLLYENERKGIFPYFTSKSSDYLLAEQPDVIGDIVRDSKVKRKKGVHMVQTIKDWGEREIRDWLNEEISPGVKQLTRIMSIPLLQELIAYNDTGNFDRVMALMMVMIYKKELHKVQVKEKTNQSKSDPFLSGPIFAKERVLNYNLR